MKFLILFLLFILPVYSQIRLGGNNKQVRGELEAANLKKDDAFTWTGQHIFNTNAFGIGGTPSPAYQLFVSGAGQATINPTDAGAKFGAALFKDTGASVDNGGMILFGASQGFFAGIKGAIQNGSNNTTGELHILTRVLNTDTQLTSAAMWSAAGNYYNPSTMSGGGQFNLGGTPTAGNEAILIRQTIDVGAVSGTQGIDNRPLDIAATNNQNYTAYSFQAVSSLNNANSSSGGEHNGYGCFHEGDSVTTPAGLFCGDFHTMRDTGAVMGDMVTLEIGVHSDIALSTSYKNYGLHLWQGVFDTVQSPVTAGSAINIEGSWTYPLSYYASGLNNKHNVTPTTYIDTTGNFTAVSLLEGANAVPNATNNLSFFSSTTSAQLAGVLSDETGSGGGFVRATLPTFDRAIITGSSFPVLEVTRTTTATNFIVSTTEVKSTSSNDIVDGFGTRLGFTFEDTGGEFAAVGGVSTVRNGADNTTYIALEAASVGTLNQPLRAYGTGGVQINDLGAKPTCAVGIRGMIWYEAGVGGVADTIEICGKDAADVYAWVALATF